VIILDTNVVSEFMREKPAAAVMRWFRDRPRSSLYTTAITEAEILLGLELMPQGKRREALLADARAIFDSDFGGRILPFGSEAAARFATIVVERRRQGRPLSGADAQIAGIAAAHGAGIATRDVTDFTDCGLTVHDPWA
jgi:predicted nucleic acid-binding protein